MCSALPYRPSSTHRSTAGPKKALAALHQMLGNERAIIVQASCHGPDTKAMMDAIGSNPRAYRGVCIANYIFLDEGFTDLAAGGVRELVVDAGLRNIADLNQMNFPVWQRAISPKVTVKSTSGALNVTFISEGQLVFPEDVIVADAVGGCHVARNDVKKILQAAEKRTDNEEDKLVRLAAGELGIDIYNMRPPL